MANLPEKNVVLVDKITNVPTDSNLFINANGEFKQASVNDVVNSSTVVSTAVETAINTAVQDSIDSNFKQTSGSPILLTDSADGTLIDFRGKGRSTQNGTPTPDNPIAIKSVADSGYFDGELLQGFYSGTGVFTSNSVYVCSYNPIPCNSGDTIKIIYATISSELALIFYDKDMNFISRLYDANVTEYEEIAPTNAKYVHFYLREPNAVITPTTAKPITVTINGKYALIVKSEGKNLYNINGLKLASSGATSSVNGDTITVTGTYYIYQHIKVKPNTNYYVSGSLDSYTSYGRLVIYSSDFKTQLNAIAGNAIGKIGFAFNSSSYTDIVLVLYGGNATSGTSVYSNIQLEENTVPTDYEPYKEAVTYIPLNEPLRSSLDGTVTDEVSLTEVTRRYAEVVFDGSSDELWSTYAPQESRPDGTYCYFVSVPDNKKMEYNSSTCTHFNNKVSAWTIGDVGTFSDHNKNNYLYFVTDKSTFSEWKTWLQANPITVQYELAEPITEEIEPVDITTYDNVTYLTASDNADMEIEYPTTKVAGIASIGYSKGIKAEYETEQLKKQLLEIQATIVNTL